MKKNDERKAEPKLRKSPSEILSEPIPPRLKSLVDKIRKRERDSKTNKEHDD